jgi:excisionase family DNA binding protein
MQTRPSDALKNMVNLTIPRFDKLGYSVAEIARGYGLSPGFVRLEIVRGKLKAKHFGRRVVILKEDLDRYLSRAE